jgi:hypothetical protein
MKNLCDGYIPLCTSPQQNTNGHAYMMTMMLAPLKIAATTMKYTMN